MRAMRTALYALRMSHNTIFQAPEGAQDLQQRGQGVGALDETTVVAVPVPVVVERRVRDDPEGSAAALGLLDAVVTDVVDDALPLAHLVLRQQAEALALEHVAEDGIVGLQPARPYEALLEAAGQLHRLAVVVLQD